MGLTLLSGGSYQTLSEPLPWPTVGYGSVTFHDGLSRTYEEIWRRQPNVRTVVDFLGRNIAQLAIHAFRRVSDTDRERVNDHPLVRALSVPNPTTTRYRLVDATVRDVAIYDRAYWVKLRTAAGDVELRRLPPRRVVPKTGDWLDPKVFELHGPKGVVDLDPATVIWFRGYDPDGVGGFSPMETLRRILAEDEAAGEYREQMWRNGARHTGYIKRPTDAPEWSDTARSRFMTDWRARYSSQGPDAGGTPLLEDGMEFVGTSFSAEASQYIQSRKLTREEVAAAYFIPPPMVGLLDRATFSNITEQHKMLYQDTLGPWLTMIQEELALQLVPEFPDVDGLYLEFNIAEKLKGSFEEQASALQTMVGAPVLTRNEGRARLNLPSLDGGDELVTPLNVLIGGQASPTDSAPKAGLPFTKSAPTMKERRLQQLTDSIARFVTRQERSVMSGLGSGKAIPPLLDAWGDADRWNTELAGILLPILLATASDAAGLVIERHGTDDTDFDQALMVPYLAVLAEEQAKATNAATYDDLAEVVSGPDWRAGALGVFATARESRARGVAQTTVTSSWGLGTSDAARALGLKTKTWRVRSSNPRRSHARVDGETVPVGEKFSNGARWPGDRSLKTEDRAKCTCDLEVSP